MTAATKAAAKMREILDTDKLSELSFSEVTEDGYRTDVSITDVVKDRTEYLWVNLFQIDVTIHWIKGTKEKSFTLRSMKVMKKEI